MNKVYDQTWEQVIGIDLPLLGHHLQEDTILMCMSSSSHSGESRFKFKPCDT